MLSIIRRSDKDFYERQNPFVGLRRNQRRVYTDSALRQIRIGMVILFAAMLPALAAAEPLPKWVNNPPKNTNDVSYFVGRGEDESLEEARADAFYDISSQLFWKVIRKQVTISFDLYEGDSEYPWLRSNSRLIDEFYITNEENNIAYYALYEVSRYVIDIINWLTGLYVPALVDGSIDQAVYYAAIQLAAEAPAGSRVAVINVASDDKALGEFVLEELTGYLSSSTNIRLFDRKSLDSIQTEISNHR
jgi:hypothetical protein